jgi:hypothetical protein
MECGSAGHGFFLQSEKAWPFRVGSFDFHMSGSIAVSPLFGSSYCAFVH